jgi:predicted AlkP superfamily pyrophosphatase or phosphodiesterase
MNTISKISTLLIVVLTLQFSIAGEKPYVILVSFDGFRWDYANRVITPNLDKFKESGVSAFSLEPVYPTKTFPNHISIVTGMYPEIHGIILNEFSNPFSGEEYRMSHRDAVSDSKWYRGEFFWETAERQGIITASYFWPGLECQYTGGGSFLLIRPPEGKIDAAYALLKKKANFYRVYLREEVPDFFHFSDHPFIPPIVLIADMGWSLHTNHSLEKLLRKGYGTGGNHGYDNHHLDMHGIFYAMGPAFKKGYRTGTLRNIDVYPLLCEIFGIMPRQNIDGQLERISFILRGN